MSTRVHLGIGLVAAVLLSACGERDQTLEAKRKTDTKSWSNRHATYLAPGWKPSDEASWREQLNDRTKAQNEYTRVPASR
jgi:hypothetical protein